MENSPTDDEEDDDDDDSEDHTHHDNDTLVEADKDVEDDDDDDDDADDDDPTAVSYFDALPQELVDHIASYLFPPYTLNSTSIAASTTHSATSKEKKGEDDEAPRRAVRPVDLMYVCTTLTRACRPYMYRSPTLTGRNVRLFCECVEASHRRPRVSSKPVPCASPSSSVPPSPSSASASSTYKSRRRGQSSAGSGSGGGSGSESRTTRDLQSRTGNTGTSTLGRTRGGAKAIVDNSSATRTTTVTSARTTAATGSMRPLGELVHTLDLRPILQGAKHSQLSRLIRRCAAPLTNLYAPQIGFSQSVVRTVGLTCRHLRVLDLSGLCEKVEISVVVDAICRLPALESVNFPRFSRDSSSASVKGQRDLDYTDTGPDDGDIGDRTSSATGGRVEWPHKLRHVGLSGAISDQFLMQNPLPESIRSLGLQYCSDLTTAGFHQVLSAVSPHLESLSVLYPMHISSDALDRVLVTCRKLKYLRCYVEYISRSFLLFSPLDTASFGSTRSATYEASVNATGLSHLSVDRETLPPVNSPLSTLEAEGEGQGSRSGGRMRTVNQEHPLTHLHLTSAGSLLPLSNKISADDILASILSGPLVHLRVVTWGLMLGWREEHSAVRDLGDVLEDQGGYGRCVG